MERIHDNDRAAAAGAVRGECHAHLAMDGVDFAAAMARHAGGPDDAHIRACLRAYREHGIGFVRDGGDAHGVSERARQLAPEYGIDYRTPVFAIHRAGTYGGIVGRGYADLDEYERLVEEAIARGADFIKVMTSGIMDFTAYGRIVYGEGLPAAEVRELVRIAHGHGRAVMAHVNGARAVQAAAEAGADSVEHGNYLDERAIAALAEHGTCLVPTMAVAANLPATPRRAPGRAGRARWEPDVVARICQTERQVVRAAWEAGVTLACGSDAGAVGVPHGRGALDERGCLARALGAEAADAAIARGQAFIERTFRPWA